MTKPLTNREAWKKGYADGFTGRNSRPDYPLVGLAGSYRAGYQAGEKRRKEPKGPSGKRRQNPTITGLKGELWQVDKDIAELETDPFYRETPGRRAYRAKWLAYHRRQRRELEKLLRGLEKTAMRRNNGIVEAAAGLQALDYLGGKAKRSGLGRKAKYNPKRRIEKPFAVPVKTFTNSGRWESASKPVMAISASEAQEFVRESFLIRGGGGSATAGETAGGIKWRIGKPRAISLAEFNRLQRRWNPRVKGSRDALGVWHAENPSEIKRAILTKAEHQTLKNEYGMKKANRAVNWFYEQSQSFRASIKHLPYIRANEYLWNDARYDSYRNPSVTDLSRTFQGEADGSVEKQYAANGAPANLARAGKLVFLKVNGKTFRLPGAMVAIAPNERLWITGPGPLFQTKARKGEGLDVGEVSHICYLTAKSHIENGKTVEYVHEFGEEGGRRPRLIIDSEGMPILRGGDYKIRAEGIVN